MKPALSKITTLPEQRSTQANLNTSTIQGLYILIRCFVILGLLLGFSGCAIEKIVKEEVNLTKEITLSDATSKAEKACEDLGEYLGLDAPRMEHLLSKTEEGDAAWLVCKPRIKLIGNNYNLQIFFKKDQQGLWKKMHIEGRIFIKGGGYLPPSEQKLKDVIDKYLSILKNMGIE